MSVKAAAVAALTQDALVPLWRSFARDLVVILMVHRFEDKDLNIRGTSPAALRANLEFLRRHRFPIASLAELIDGNGAPPAHVSGPTVVFTVDDGYADFARIGAPIFAAFDCPVTAFLVTDSVDRNHWFWWDRVEFIIESSSREDIDLDLSTGRLRRPRRDQGDVKPTVTAIVEALKLVPDAERERALATLASYMSVEVAPHPPPRYAPLSWSDVNRCTELGVTFGPHTVHHPMLTQVDPATASSEILDSWTRLQQRCSSAVPIFCYPNGAYSAAHVDILARSPIRAGLSTEPGYATRAMFASRDPATRFAIPRFPYSERRDRFVRVVTGMERFKMGIIQALTDSDTA